MPSTPVVVSCLNASEPQGSTHTMFVSGSGFVTGATWAFSGTGITISSTLFENSSTYGLLIVIDPDATLGARDLTITNADTGTGTGVGVFTVIAGPTFTGVTGAGVGDDDYLSQGSTYYAVFTGTGFQSGATFAMSGPGITISSSTFVYDGEYDLTLVVDGAATLGAADGDITITNPDGGTTTFNAFVVVGPQPTITTMAPASVGQGEEIDLVLTGTNYVEGIIFGCSSPDLTSPNLAVNSDTQITVTVFAPIDATLGAFDVSVSNPDHSSFVAPGALTITALDPSTPTITSISPAEMAEGASGDIVVTGTELSINFTPSFSATGITITDYFWTDDTSVTVSVAIDGAAPLGAGDLTITNYDTGTATLSDGFTITAGVLAVTSIDPTSMAADSGGVAEIFGTGFVDTPTVDLGDDGVTIISVTFGDSTFITFDVELDPDATLSVRDVVVTNPDTTTATLPAAFTVTAAVIEPHITSIFPNTAAQGSDFTVDVVGTDFQDGCEIAFSGTGINVGTVTFNSDTSLTVALTIDGGAPPGGQDFQVFNPDDGESDITFTVLSSGGGDISAPTVTGAIPGSMNQGDTGTVEVIGTGFVDGCTVEVSGDTVVNSVTFASSTEVDVNVTIAGDATGTLTFSVTNPDTGQGSAPILGIDLPPPVTLLSAGFGPLGGDVHPSLTVSQPSPYNALNLLSARSNGGVGLACTDPTNLLANVAMTRRRVMVASSFTDGQTQVWSVRDKSSLSMTIACLAYDHATLQTLIAAVVGAFDQPSYLLTLDLDGIGYRWNCDNADWSVDFNQAFWHFYSAYIHLSIPRNPVPNVGPI